MINIKILTAYPEMFPGTLGLSLMGRALRDKKFSMDIINLHDFGISQRKNIDDIPFITSIFNKAARVGAGSPA